MADVVFESVTCRYPGTDEPAVRDLDLSIADGSLFVLCGPPESGKSTVLRMLAGLVPVTAGRILVGGHDIAVGDAPKVTLVFQNYALYPHLTVGQNIGLPLARSKVGKREISDRIAEAAAPLDLADALSRNAATLSAGARMRVAVARGLVRRPAVMLMDEPLANLHPDIRAEVTEMLVTAQSRHRITTVYASADAQEALALGDRVAVIDAGVLQEVVVPSEIDEPPAGQTGQRRATPQ